MNDYEFIQAMLARRRVARPGEAKILSRKERAIAFLEEEVRRRKTMEDLKNASSSYKG